MAAEKLPVRVVPTLMVDPAVMVGTVPVLLDSLSVPAPLASVVTWPTTFEQGPERATVIWHDLYLDLIGFPDGHFLILDEDELEASDLMESDPDLVILILLARDTMIARFVGRDFPFHEG